MEEDHIITEEPGNQEEPGFFKLFSEASLQEVPKSPNSNYEDGKVLPKTFRARYLTASKHCVPLEEIDPYYRNKQTFVVIGKWGTIHRFSYNPNGYLVLRPDNATRRLALYLLTNWTFSTFIVATVLVNIAALITTHNFEIMLNRKHHVEEDSVVNAMYILNYLCIAIYGFELVVKLVARGLGADSFTSIRDPWTYLDILVILTGLYPYHTFILYQRSAVWLRVFKIIPLVPSIHQACKLSLNAVVQLRGMMIHLGLLLWFFSLVGVHFYMGIMTRKCISNIPDGTNISDKLWFHHNLNQSNWYGMEHGNPILCGNDTGTLPCPENYTCLQGFGRNPDYDTTSFDNVFISLLSIIRIASEDFTETIFKQVLETSGPWHILFFEAIFFIITVPMGCLFFGVLGKVLKDSKEPVEVEVEDETGDATEWDGEQNPESLILPGRKSGSQEELHGFRKTMHSVMFHCWTKTFLVLVIIIDTIAIATYNYYIHESHFTYRYVLMIRLIPPIVGLVYTTEFILKMITLGPIKYFKNVWHLVDFIVLLTFFVEFGEYFEAHPAFLYSPIRLWKLIQYWPTGRMIFTVYFKTIKAYTGWIMYSLIVLGFLVLIGPSEVGKFDLDRHKQANSSDAHEMPDWGFVDFWVSFRTVYRMLIAEWIETFWDCYNSAGTICVFYYLAVNLCGALLVSFVLVGVVYSTVQELQNNFNPSKESGLRLLVRQGLSWICSLARLFQRTNIQRSGSELGGRDVQTSKLKEFLKSMQESTESLAYKIVCNGVIVIASVAMIFESNTVGDNTHTALFVIELLFTIIFLAIVVYELLAFGLKESISNRGWLFDAAIVLEMILNLTLFKFSYSGPFVLGVFYIRSFRPLMLVSRIECLQASFKGLNYEVKTMWETVLAILFIWLFFDMFSVHWLAGQYYICLEDSGNEVAPSLGKVSCLANNFSWVQSHRHFDNVADGFLNMVFLATRMGWINIVNDASAATGQDMPRERDYSRFWFFFFICFVVVGAFGALGILFSYIFNKFQQDNGYSLILTKSQNEIYNRKRVCKARPQGIVLEDEWIPPPETSCSRSTYNFVTNVKFDAFIMGIIIIDNICLSLEHYKLDITAFDTHIIWVDVVVLLLFLVEMILKVVAWRKFYFKSAWNLIDFTLVLTGVLELFILEVGSNVYSTRLLRTLRLFRIFRFLLAEKWGSPTAKIFVSAIFNIRHAFMNLLLFQLTVMWAFGLLGTFLFSKAKWVGALNHIIHFENFQSSLWTLILLLSFPGLDGLLVGLGNEEDCDIGDLAWEKVSITERGNCGHKPAAVWFLGLYISTTFLILLNIYSVFISEIIFEISRLTDASQSTETVVLQDISVENERKNGDEEIQKTESMENAGNSLSGNGK